MDGTRRPKRRGFVACQWLGGWEEERECAARLGARKRNEDEGRRGATRQKRLEGMKSYSGCLAFWGSEPSEGGRVCLLGL